MVAGGALLIGGCFAASGLHRAAGAVVVLVALAAYLLLFVRGLDQLAADRKSWRRPNHDFADTDEADERPGGLP